MRALPDENLKYPVLITLEDGATGSGFFLNDSDQSLYLVTAKHVLFNPQSNLLWNELAKITSYADNNEITDPIIFRLDFSILSKTGCIIFDKKYDAVAVKITTGSVSKNGLKMGKLCDGVSKIQFPEGAKLLVAEKVMCKKFDDVLVANDAFIIGYPTSIGDKKVPQINYEQPLVRKGIVAGKNQEKRTIIIDCEVYYGNSGGIVIELEQLDYSTKRPWVIGLISELVPFSKKWTQNSGYSVVVPIEIVLDLLESKK